MSKELMLAEAASKTEDVRLMGLAPHLFKRFKEARDEHIKACKKDIDTVVKNWTYGIDSDQVGPTGWESVLLKPRSEDGYVATESTKVYVQKKKPPWSAFKPENMSDLF